VEFEYKDVQSDPNAVTELIDTYDSRQTPTLVVGEEVLIGFDPQVKTRLNELLGIG
tara:strand:+ start:720 stop:887 length:168 start_codon:yes stop_codon:yes gene_type:complete